MNLNRKVKQYRVSILDKKKKALVSRINKKMNNVDVFFVHS